MHLAGWQVGDDNFMTWQVGDNNAVIDRLNLIIESTIKCFDASVSVLDLTNIFSFV